MEKCADLRCFRISGRCAPVAHSADRNGAKTTKCGEIRGIMGQNSF